MKFNSQKLLLWLYPFEKKQDNVKNLDQFDFVDFEELKFILPELTISGLRSLIFLLEKKNYVYSVKLGEVLQVKITKLGMKVLEEQIPALKREQSEIHKVWSVLIFLRPPSSDKNFRYLRTYLLNKKAIVITRGVYFYPGFLGEKERDLLEGMYHDCVLVVATNNFILSDEQKIIGSQIGLSDSIEALSGIGNEVSSLLIKKTKTKRLTRRQKIVIVSIFDRLFDLLKNDYGLARYFFPQIKQTSDYFLQLQNIVRL